MQNSAEKKFFIFGSRHSLSAVKNYQRIADRIKKTTSIEFHLLHSNSNFKILNNGKCPICILPLLLTRGIEYENLNNLLSQYQLNYEILPPYSETESFREYIKQAPEYSSFFLHGTRAEHMQHIHNNLRNNLLKWKPNSDVFFVEQKPSITDFVTSKIAEEKKQTIVPLFFFEGKHIQEDLMNAIPRELLKKQWSINPCLLSQDEDIDLLCKEFNFFKGKNSF